MIAEGITALEAFLTELVLLLLQLAYCLVLLSVAAFVTAAICLPLIVAYCKYMDRKKAKHKAPIDPSAPADVDQVKGRAPGSSDHAPPIRRTEARAKQPLERPPP